jgi:hypothetical protein
MFNAKQKKGDETFFFEELQPAREQQAEFLCHPPLLHPLLIRAAGMAAADSVTPLYYQH